MSPPAKLEARVSPASALLLLLLLPLFLPALVARLFALRLRLLIIAVGPAWLLPLSLHSRPIRPPLLYQTCLLLVRPRFPCWSKLCVPSLRSVRFVKSVVVVFFIFFFGSTSIIIINITV
jgi:hypothetical protein